MNALFIKRMSEYVHSAEAFLTAQAIIKTKISRQNVLLKRYQKPTFPTEPRSHTATLSDLLLYEARAAKHFWRYYAELLPEWTNFQSRTPKSDDVTNKLLDIGYHHLTNVVKSTLTEKDISPALAILHQAQQSDSAPLAYDLVELFRTDVVDTEVAHFLRQRKIPQPELKQRDIGHFLHNVNERLEKQYYLKDFRQCHTYRYYLDIQITKFIKAVNHSEVFAPLWLPTRHDLRCTCKLPKPML
jgi:CRISPR-associated endonuclease Cas1